MTVGGVEDVPHRPVDRRARFLSRYQEPTLDEVNPCLEDKEKSMVRLARVDPSLSFFSLSVGVVGLGRSLYPDESGSQENGFQ